jgi:hypothetical protein
MSMLELSWANSGEALYLANSLSHSAWLMGQREPVTGRHSVMLSLFNLAGAMDEATLVPTQTL